mgnify:CR=1 FL=1
MAYTEHLSLVNFECYLATDSSQRLIGMTDVELPTITHQTVKIAGNGVAGQYDMPVAGHIESMELKLNFRLLDSEQADLFKHRVIDLDLRGSQEREDVGNGTLKQIPIKVLARGIPKEWETGKFEPHATNETTYTIALQRLELLVDNTREMLYDVFNYILEVDGTDELAQVRRNLGR